MEWTTKAIGLALALVACLVAVVPGAAMAETGGHFTTELAHTAWEGAEVKASGHATKWTRQGNSESIECTSSTYSGTTGSITVTEVTLTPTYSGCKTAAEGPAVSIHSNGCAYVLKIGKKATADNTMQLTCPGASKLEITHPSCTIKLPPQTFSQGAAYTKIFESGKAALTFDLTAQAAAQFEAGICIFLGTNHTFNLTGSIVVTGKTTAGTATGIEATGWDEAQFRFEAGHTFLTGAQSGANKTTLGALLGTVECTNVALEGTTAVGSSDQVTVMPAYSGCSGSGREWTVHMNGCAYVLTVESSTSGKVDVECPVGKSIETTIDNFPEGCTVTIPPQTPAGVVDYKEEGTGTGRDLLLTWTLEGIHYTRDGCEVGGTGNNGTMSGSITLSGEDTSGNPRGIWIE